MANLNRKLAGGLHGRSYITAAWPGLGKSIWVSTFALSAPLGKGSAAWSTPERCHVQS